MPFNGDVNTNYANSNANLSTIFSNLNSNRLPDYARVDASVTKTWRFDEHRSLELDLGVTNTLDRQNIFYFDRMLYERVGTGYRCCRARGSITGSGGMALAGGYLHSLRDVEMV
ncbi:MAG: hypothetical protein IPP83_12585 [Flavobacteriales bacterium]|nr:hypothetical protein [Flavobacteriales bacterium]